jgi:tape measure domain-containing protein
MASVDERVVRMEFDNASFQRKVDQTLSSLGQLDKAMKMEGAQKGLQSVSDTASKFSLGGIAEGVKHVGAGFLGMATIGVTALSNITNKAVDAGIKLVKSLAFDQINAGFKEYEMSMNSIQTILANTGGKSTLGDVNKALDQLNTYADKTIYNFGQMTKNIGTFTAAGVDLQTSVSSIKGIANLAAISGSSADQASTAMYQLSQAIASGSLKLQDWNSVVNAGMGGKVFQNALFESGKAMKTLKNVPMGQTFDQWTKSGHNFRESLKDGWVNAEVLTTTLGGVSGELTDAQLAAKGFSKDAIKNLQNLGKTGVDAATKVRTLTQLVDTTKEAIGSGWSESFRIILGNFDQATNLFTGLSNAINKFVDKMSAARNKLLQGWSDLGGRTLLLQSLGKMLQNIGAILKPIGQAFRELFPPMTAKGLMDLTKSFAAFVDKLKPSQQTIGNIKRIFEGFFSVLRIGWDLIKGGVKLVATLVGALTGLGSGPILAGVANIADFFTKLQKNVLSSDNIKKFFSGIGEAIKTVAGLITDLKDKIVGFFSKSPVDKTTPGIDRVASRFENLKNILSKLGGLWDPFLRAMEKVGSALGTAWKAIAGFFSDLGKNIADALKGGDWNAVFDAINTGLLGGIALLIARFLKGGININVAEGLMGSISGSFDQLTGVLQAMQTKIKADALMKIALAIGVLTASVVVLSLIDSAALTKSLAAMAVGFGELMGAFALLNKISSGPKAAASFDMIAAGMIGMSTAVLILAGSVKILGDMDWESLGRGLGGVLALLGIMVATALLLEGKTATLIAAGLGITGMATGIAILAGAVKLFGDMSWTSMGKGIAGVAGGLLIIAAAMKLMPLTMPLIGAGLLMVAISLGILAKAMKSIAKMSWGEIGKGLAGIAGALLAIGLAMNIMPSNMILTAAGLLLVAIALQGITKALAAVGGLSWGEIAKGLVGIAGSLAILAVALYAMSGTLLGAAALTVASAALLILAGVLKVFAGIGWGDLLHGLLALAIALAAIALASMALSPAVPYILALGIALGVLGGAFALFGAGVFLVAKGMDMLAQSGVRGSKAFVKTLENMGKAIPAFLKGFLAGWTEIVTMLLKMVPGIVKVLLSLLSSLLDGLKTLIPKAAAVIGQLITSILDLIKTKIPEYARAGLEMLLGLLQGIRDNIGQIVTVVGEIVTNFLNALSTQLANIVQSVANLIITLFTNVANAVGKVAGTLMFGIGIAFINGFMQGILGAQPGVTKWFTSLAGNVLKWIGNIAGTLIGKGRDLLSGLLNGISAGSTNVINWFRRLAGNVLSWVGNLLGTLVGKGRDVISGLYNGMVGAIGGVSGWLSRLGGNVISWVGNAIGWLAGKGRDIIQGMYNGLTGAWGMITGWLSGIGSRAAGAVGNLGGILTGAGRSIMDGLLSGITDAWNKVAGTLSGLADKIKSLKGPPKKDAKILVENGMLIMQGLQQGIEDEWDNVANWLSSIDPAAELDKNIGDRMSNVLNSAITDMVSQLETMPEMSPTITPVLDLTDVAKGAQQISDYISANQTVTPKASYAQARTIATSTSTQADSTAVTDAATSAIKFEQNIYAPTQLSTSDIYRNTRNQITMAKQELSIP